MPCTGLKCLNTNFICYATQLPPRGGGGIIFNSEFDFFGGDDLHLQIIASISPKASGLFLKEYTNDLIHLPSHILRSDVLHDQRRECLDNLKDDEAALVDVQTWLRATSVGFRKKFSQPTLIRNM